MITIEPPSCGFPLVFIGKNNRGQWVAQEKNGLFGGLFVNRANAMRFALLENGRHPEAVIELYGMLELDMTAPHSIMAQTRASVPDRRRAA